MKKIIWILCAAIAVSACTTRQPANQTITVSILPVKFLVEQITGNDFTINLLVPPGASPETYEPTPQQMKRIVSSDFLFSTGLMDFERQLTHDIALNMNHVNIVDLSQGILLIKGAEDHHDRGHAHGVDPHIWTSPKNLKIMAGHIFQVMQKAYPDSIRYQERYQDLLSRLDSLDSYIRNKVQTARHHTFIIYHPALTYLAQEYALKQVAVENEGKEPSADQIRQLISLAKTDSLHRIFYQSQFSQAAVAAIAKEIGAKTIAIDPLAEQVIDNLQYMVNLITE